MTTVESAARPCLNVLDAKESLQAFVDRRERQFREAEGNDSWISDMFKGFMVEEGASLSGQGRRMYAGLARGDL
eukprot:3047574-Pyramimonas_sp.AAC.1